MVGCNVIYINQLAAQCAPFVWRDFWLREGAYTGACLCFSRRDTIPFCQWWFYVIQLRRWMVLFSVLFMLYLLGCAAVVITQCDEVACALIVSTLSIKYKHTDTHTHAEHRINCDCLYTYIKTKHAADGNGFAHRFVVLLYLYFFWNVLGCTLFFVYVTKFKMDCNVDTGNFFSMLTVQWCFRAQKNRQKTTSHWTSILLNVHLIFSANKLKYLLNDCLKVLKLFWSTNQFGCCYIQFRSE